MDFYISALVQGPPGLPGLKGDPGSKGEKVSPHFFCFHLISEVWGVTLLTPISTFRANHFSWFTKCKFQNIPPELFCSDRNMQLVKVAQMLRRTFTHGHFKGHSGTPLFQAFYRQMGSFSFKLMFIIFIVIWFELLVCCVSFLYVWYFNLNSSSYLCWGSSVTAGVSF